ncbi:MAG: ABC transporter ATP-binding protein [Bacillota bacterium]
MLVVENLTKKFKSGLFKTTTVQAVNDVSFTLRPGEAFGLIGNSGSGKSTLARLLVRLLEPSAGRVIYQGTDLTALPLNRFQPYRQKIQLIFQQPTLALNPRRTVWESLTEPWFRHGLVKTREQARAKAADLMALTNLSEEVLERYPRQISGGQAQRVIIARSLGMEPEIIIADEPTSMLDVSVQAQILRLLKVLQQERGISILLISHDPSVIKSCCDRVALIQAGQIVAVGEPSTVLAKSNKQWQLSPGPGLIQPRPSLVPQTIS